MKFLNAFVCSQSIQSCGENDFTIVNHSLGMKLVPLIYDFNRGRSNGVPKTNPTITLISFASDNILTRYAAYSFTINTLYALKMNYSLSLFAPSLSDVFDPVDYRWSRVKILNWMFKGSGKDLSDKYSSYFVWIDADLIFLDFDFDILQDVIYYDIRTKHADIIISAENHAETGVANTGFFIIKNSSWSRRFVSQWWQEDNATRASAHDQIYFDRLYKRYLKENPIETHRHIVILPTRALNSMPPALLQLAESDRVLHLMGEKDELREVVFSYALQQWCCSNRSVQVANDNQSSYHRQQQGRLSRPLNITPVTLINISYGWYSATLAEAMLFINNTVSFITNSTSINSFSQACDILSHIAGLFETIGNARELLLQIRKLEFRLHDDLSLTAKSLQKIFSSILSLSRKFQSLFPHAQGIPLCRTDTTWSYHFFPLHLNNFCALIGNDYLGILSEASGWAVGSPLLSPSFEEQVRMYSIVEDCLYSMEAVTNPTSKPAVLSTLAIFLQNMGAFYLSQSGSSHRRRGLQLLERSVDILWNELSEGAVNPFQKVSPALLLGSALCTEDNINDADHCSNEGEQGKCNPMNDDDDDSSCRHRRGEKLLSDTIRLLEQLLFAEQQLKEDHINYVHALVAAANCRRLLHSAVGTVDQDVDPHIQKLVLLKERFCAVGEKVIAEEGSQLCPYLDAALHQLRNSLTQTISTTTQINTTISNISTDVPRRKKKRIYLSRRF